MSRVRAKRSLGQNFLVDPNLQRKIVDALDPAPGDRVLEVGPGRGALTDRLVPRVDRLVAVELDDDLAAELSARFADRPGVEIVKGNALELDPRAHELEPYGYKAVGNIPYNITSPLIFHLLERAWRPALLVLLLQREVAERIAAPPGTRTYGALSVGVRTVAEVELLFRVGRGAFRPVPRVDSTVLAIRPLVPPPLSGGEERRVRTLTRALFGQRRKQLQKILRTHPELQVSAQRIAELERASGLSFEARPETLPPEEIVRLARLLDAPGSGQEAGA